MQVIIYPNDDSTVSIVVPAPEFADQIEAIAAKDVPQGKPFRIIDSSEIPQGDAFTWSESGPILAVTLQEVPNQRSE
jgi:hypothetical protein